jgi:hypothetical protein
MSISGLKYKILSLLIVTGTVVLAQDPGDVSNLLQNEVENWNPVYKPVIGFGSGTFNFYGDVESPDQTPFNGDLAYKINISTFIDNNHYFRANFYLMGGNMSGNERSYQDTTRNLNFKSNVFVFGVNVNYDFDHFYKTYRKLHPFVSLGIEMMTFDSKTDLKTTVEGVDVPYYYWTDGSIRNGSQQTTPDASLLRRDYTYETSVGELDYGLDAYPQYTFAVPIDIGLDYQVTDRVMFRIGTSFHYMFSDLVDHVSSENTKGVIGDEMNDFFTFSYISLHLDLFSSAKTLTWEKLYAEVEWDGTLMDDEDGDGYFDGIDRCPGTPYGVKVDTAGCPLDSDLDRILDYLDDEPNSRYGVYVDDRGVEISEDDVITSLDMSKAVSRSDVATYLRTPSSYSNYKKMSAQEIPEKYKKVDIDNDAYISFDEMMDAIDGFFDFDSELSTDDIYELNNFFFSQ